MQLPRLAAPSPEFRKFALCCRIAERFWSILMHADMWLDDGLRQTAAKDCGLVSAIA